MAKEIYVPRGVTINKFLELLLAAFSRELEFDLGDVTYAAGNEFLIYKDV